VCTPFEVELFMPGNFDASAVLDPTFDPREEAASLPTERLEAEITQLAGNLAAAECRWLPLSLTLEKAAVHARRDASEPRDTGHVTTPSNLAAQLAAHVDDDFCYLTTRGRVTGNPHEIEIWFAVDTAAPTTLFLMAGGGDASDWVRNLCAEPAVTVRVGDTTYAARARVVDSESEEDERARTLVHDKFAPRYSDDLTEWRGRALPVAIDVVDVAS
jgi:deazaflavin-dependent oxidoreductase (nitroreductase family)